MRPTDAEIRDEPAGRTLDRWVIAHVLGYQFVPADPWPTPPDTPRYRDRWVEPGAKWPKVYDDDSARPQSGRCHPYLPRFSADIAAAWEVVRAMTERGFESVAQIQPKAQPSRRCLFCFLQEVPGGGKWTPHRRFEAAAETMPVAVCRAALLVVAAPA